MKIPVWVFAIVAIVAAVAIALGVHEHDLRQQALAKWQATADTAAAKSRRDSITVAQHDSAKAEADSARSVSDQKAAVDERTSLNDRRATAAAIALLHSRDTSDAIYQAAIDTLEDQIEDDSVAIASAHLARVADSLDLIRANGSITSRDDLIRDIRDQLHIAQNKPGTTPPRITPFLQAGVGLNVAKDGSLSQGVVGAGGVSIRVIGPVGVTARAQYSTATSSGTMQALLSYSFGGH